MLIQFQDQRDVYSYANFTYGWYDENAERGSGNWWFDDFARMRSHQRLQEQAHLHALHALEHGRYVPGDVNMAVGHGLPFVNNAALNNAAFNHQMQPQNSAHAHVPTHMVAPGHVARQNALAPGSLVRTNAPQLPAVLPAAIVQPLQHVPLPAVHQAHPRPTLPPNLQFTLAQRPQPPAGFNDQPPARMTAGNYLNPNLGGPRRTVQWPENIDISLVEICTFCPQWLQNPEVVGRAIRNGWPREALAKAQLLVEDPATRDTLDRRSSRLQKQISTGCKLLDGEPDATRFNSDDFRARHGMQFDLTANAWRFKHSYDPERNAYEWLGDMPLSAFYTNVFNWPTGNDRLLMTQCLEFARANPGRQLDTSHWDWIITSQNLTAPPPPANGLHRDVDALQRLALIPNPP